jgi:hypothetical protein
VFFSSFFVIACRKKNIQDEPEPCSTTGRCQTHTYACMFWRSCELVIREKNNANFPSKRVLLVTKRLP